MTVLFTSFICVTNRPAHFKPMIEQFLAQDVPEKELVLVDNSDEPLFAHHPNFFPACASTGLIYTHVKGKRMVGELRNVGLSMAHGDLITWLDDDDWRHPDSVPILWEAMEAGNYDLVGPKPIWFVDEAGNTRLHKCETLPVFGATLLNRKAAAVKFNEQAVKASDNPWLKEVRRDLKMGLTDHEFILVAVSHGKNISNPLIENPLGVTLDDLDQRIGPEFGLKDHVDRLFAAIKAEEA